MKAVLINSSARINGNTAKVLSIIKDVLEKNNSTVETVVLAKMKINMCLGCRKCFDEGECACPGKDDVIELYNKIKSADLVIIGGPVYVEDVNGILKNWIDRMAFNCHRPELFNQKAYVVLNSGSGASWHAVKTIERALMSWGITVLGRRKLVLGAHSDAGFVNERYRDLLKTDMEKVIKKAGNKNKPSLLQLITFSIQQCYYKNKADKQTYDYKYWKNKGLLEDRNYYFSQADGNTFKRIISRMTGKIIAKILLK